MATKATLGQGIQFKRGDGASPEVFTLVNEVKTIKLGQGSPPIDVTNMDSAAGFHEWIAGLIDGDVELSANFADATSYAVLLADQVAQARHNYKMVFPAAITGLGSGRQLAFATIITKLDIDAGATSPISATFSFKITNAIAAS